MQGKVQGKTIQMTSTTSGVGRVTTLALAARGAQLVVITRRLSGTANAMHPGVINSNFGSVIPEQGAETPVCSANSPEVEGVRDKSFEEQRTVSLSKASSDHTITKPQRHVSERLTDTSRVVSA